MKRKTAILLSIVMALSLGYSAYADEITLGDINADGKVTATDAAMLFLKVHNNTFVTGIETKYEAEEAYKLLDINGDGSIDEEDWKIVLNISSMETTTATEETTETVTEETAQEVTYTSEIVLSDTQITVNELTESNGGVEIHNDEHYIVITNGGSYTVTGSLSNGQIRVDSAADVEINLSGADINCSDGPAIYGINGDIDISAKKGTKNTLSDGTPSEFETETDADGNITATDEPDGCIFSHDGIKLKGKGDLTINGNYSNGVSGKDEIVIQNLNLTVNAVGNAIKGKDYVTVNSGTLDLTSQTGDGIRCTKGDITIVDGSITITAQDNGLFAKAGNIIISGGTQNITVVPSGTADTTTYNYDGIHTKVGTISITGGEITVKSYCDGIQAAGDLTIDGSAIINITTTGQISSSSSSSGGFGGWQNNQTADISAKGIKSDTILTIDGDAQITIDSTDDSLHTNSDITIGNAVIEVSSGDDGVHADTTLTVNSGCDLKVNKSYEGIEGENIYLNGGKIIIYADDDSINAAGGNDGSSQGGFNTNADGYIEINGGYIYCENTKDGDGIDSNGKIVMNDGVLLINGPTGNGNGAIDFGDKSTDSFAFNGGELIAVGSSGMAESPTSGVSEGYTVTYGFSSNAGGNSGPGGNSAPVGNSNRGGSFGGNTSNSSSIPAGTLLTLKDESGNVIMAFKTAVTAQTVVISSSSITSGAKYTLSSGGTYSGTLDEQGYGKGGSVSGATALASGTVSGKVTALS